MATARAGYLPPHPPTARLALYRVRVANPCVSVTNTYMDPYRYPLPHRHIGDIAHSVVLYFIGALIDRYTLSFSSRAKLTFRLEEAPGLDDSISTWLFFTLKYPTLVEKHNIVRRVKSYSMEGVQRKKKKVVSF